MERILITGIGLVSTELADQLTKQGYKVCFLSRSLKPNFNYPVYLWNIKNNFIDLDAFKNTNYIIHLAGSNISEKRWTQNRVKELEDSRIESTNLLFNAIKTNKISIKSYIGASAIGFYGSHTNDKIYSENDKSGNDFIGRLCVKWEQAHKQFETLQIPTTIIRIGVVLSNKGGALQKIIEPIEKGIGAAIGSGKQYMPWIHVSDLCNSIYKIINSEKSGEIYNMVATEHITNKGLTELIAQKLNKKIHLPAVPSFIVKILFGKMSVILLNGSRVSNKKLKKQFQIKLKFDTISKTLDDLIR